MDLNSEIFTRAVDDIITREDLKKLLASKKQLRIKFGADVTATSLHIGHAVNLWKMRALQEQGHKVVFLIGDFTTQIGDPTDRMEKRRAVDEKIIDTWAKNFIKEVGRVLLTGKNVFEVRRNSEWYKKMPACQLLELLSLFTHARLIEREMFQKRISEGKEISVPELIYPILQGYDSVMLKSDLTIVGSDQLFNENIGRTLQEKFGQPPQVLLITAITPGMDGGPKMSKSLGNYIGLDDSPRDKFGKAMRVLDYLIPLYLEVYTDVPLAVFKEKVKKSKPRDLKLFFAESLTARYHGAESAKKEREYFLRVFSKKETPPDLPERKILAGIYNLVDLLVKTGLAPSKSEARRLILQKAVEIDGEIKTDPKARLELRKETLLRVGKRKFLKIIPN